MIFLRIKRFSFQKIYSKFQTLSYIFVMELNKRIECHLWGLRLVRYKPYWEINNQRYLLCKEISLFICLRILKLEDIWIVESIFTQMAHLQLKLLKVSLLIKISINYPFTSLRAKISLLLKLKGTVILFLNLTVLDRLRALQSRKEHSILCGAKMYISKMWVCKTYLLQALQKR